MGRVAMSANNRGLISTFGQYYNRTSSSFSGIFGTATYPNRALSSLNIDYYGGSPSVYVFFLNIATSNSTKGSVSITYPWSETSSGTANIGNNRQAFSGAYNYINIQCNVAYGYTFKGWYTLPVGGTLITTGNSTNVYPTDGYINSVWYAQFN
jgi:hypothetical protein